jgi:hypothetical protein
MAASARRSRRSAQTSASTYSPNVSFTAHADPARTPASSGERRRASSAAAANPTASPSTCTPPTISYSSSGFSDHSSAARVCAAGSGPASRCRTSPVTTKASAPRAASQNTVACVEAPPSTDASHCSAVAIGPYTLDTSVHGASTACPIGSSASARVRAVSLYGFPPVAANRPYAA